MKKRIVSILLAAITLLCALPFTVPAYAAVTEDYKLQPGGTYYFDLSSFDFGKESDEVPDATLHYVPFKYVGAIQAYKLSSPMKTDQAYADAHAYKHSVFVAECIVSRVTWSDMSSKGYAYGTSYSSGNIEYEMRAPSGGSTNKRTNASPASNEWDTILDKNSEYIKASENQEAWCQDLYDDGLYVDPPFGVTRGIRESRSFYVLQRYSDTRAGYKPILEITSKFSQLKSNGLKEVTLDLDGASVGETSGSIKIIVKNGATFKAPTIEGITIPKGANDEGFKWQDEFGNLYSPGDNVNYKATTLKALWNKYQQFTLDVGETYYFDLSSVSVPGSITVDRNSGGNKIKGVPDRSLHYVPFTFAGTIDAYSLDSYQLTSEEYAEQNRYKHTLLVSDYVLTELTSWDTINAAGLIYGKDYSSGNIDYKLRAPSGGSGIDDTHLREGGTPTSNEWDQLYLRDAGLIKNNTYQKRSYGQDAFVENSASGDTLAVNRGYMSDRYIMGYGCDKAGFDPGYRPVLEIMNAAQLTADGLKEVTLDLNGGSIKDITGSIKTLVAAGKAFTAPPSAGISRPAGGTYFAWIDEAGNKYAPGESVPASVAKLTADWNAPTYTLTYKPDGYSAESDTYTDTKTYDADLTLRGETYTRIGYTQTGWTEDGSSTYALGAQYTENKAATLYPVWQIKTYSVKLYPGADGKGEMREIIKNHGEAVILPDGLFTRTGYRQIGWALYDGGERAYGTDAIYEADEAVSLYPVWQEISDYNIVFDTAGGSAVVSRTGLTWSAKVLDGVIPPTRDGYEFLGWKYGDRAVGADDTYGDIAENDSVKTVTLTAQWKDIEPPSGTVTVGTSTWREFVKTITFGLFCNDTVKVEIAAQDNSGSVTVQYFLSDKDYTADELSEQSFENYNGAFYISEENNYIVYVKLTDPSDNVSYLRSDGIVIDKTAPVISGIENGKTYCGEKTVTVSDQHKVKVFVNGSEVAPNDSASFVLGASDSSISVEAVDEAGNRTIYEVRINSGHTYGGAWLVENGKYWRRCKYCDSESDKKDIPEIEINAPGKVCRTQDITATFEMPEGTSLASVGYGDDMHGGEASSVTLENGIYTALISATDYFSDFDTIGVIVYAETSDGFRFSCMKTVLIQNSHAGGTATCTESARCDTCGESYGDKAPDNHTDTTEWVCTETEHTQKYKCCGAVTVQTEAHEWENGVCAECGYTCVHEGGIATCLASAVCKYCGESYDDKDPDNHTDTTEWICTETEHTQKYKCCGAVTVQTEAHEWENGACAECGYACVHEGGIATCLASAVCKYCGESYGDRNPDNHTDTTEWICTETEHTQKYKCCGAVTVQTEAHEWENGVCAECGYACVHSGGTATCLESAVCKYCGESYGDKDPDNHTDTTEWICTETEHTQKYKCCGAVTVQTEAHEWENGVCAECGYICAHSGGKATCTERAKCEICGEYYGELDPAGHGHVDHVDGKDATKDSEGNREYWHCDDCDGYFSDKSASSKSRISKEDTVIEKLSESGKAPRTGDGIVLLAVLFTVSCAAAAELAIVIKRKKRGER